MNLIMALAQETSATTETEAADLLFCDGVAILIIIGCIAIAIWSIIGDSGSTGGVAFFGASFIVSIICYIMAVIEEFNAGHIVHCLISVMVIIVPVSVAIVVYIKNEKVRKAEIPLIPDRVEKYISTHGYSSVNDFIKYSNENPEFAKARKVNYTNPLYEKQYEENQKRKEKKQKPIEITEPSKISYGQLASIKYKEIVLTRFMKELPATIKNIYMFDYADIYANMPKYSDFFLNNMLPDAHPIRTQPVYHEYFEDISSRKVADLPDLKSETDIYDELIQKYERIDKIYFQQACSEVIRQLIIDGFIERVASGNLFKSMIIPESDGNIVEGETIEISFDD